MKKLRLLLCVLLAFAIAFVGVPGHAYADTDDGTVYVGGFQVGISVDIDGLLVESVTGVETEYGIAAVEGIYSGDVIKSVNGSEVDSYDDIADSITVGKATLEIVRDGRQLTVEVTPVVELYTGKPKLGIKIKDKIYGVGTVTFVRGNGRFVALGHEICDGESGVRLPFDGGHIHGCKVVGIKRGTKNEAGAFIATVIPDKVLGDVTCNNSFGVAGNYTADFDRSQKLPLGGRDDVKPGAAQVRTTVNGVTDNFDIEIIKATKQSERKEKGIVFRVTDKRLLDATGGIVRGMSGSPIIQDGKVVAGVTHVLLNDSTKGYGVYADFLNP